VIRRFVKTATTNNRVIAKIGLIHRKSAEILIRKVESLNFE